MNLSRNRKPVENRPVVKIGQARAYRFHDAKIAAKQGRFHAMIPWRLRMNDDQDQAQIKVRLAQLQLEHSDMKAAIEAMTAQKCDPLQIQRMKKKKLELKDECERISSLIIPDIIA